MTLFDPDEGDRRKQEGMGRAYDHASPVWKNAGYNAIRECCETLAEYTTDQVHYRLGTADDHEDELRGLGSMMTQAAKWGWHTKTDRTIDSVRPICHKSPKRVWRSNLYRGES